MGFTWLLATQNPYGYSSLLYYLSATPLRSPIHKSISRLLHLGWLYLYVQLTGHSSIAILSVTPFSLGDWILINIRMFALKLKLSLMVIFHWLFTPGLVQMPLEGFDVSCTNYTLWETIPYFHHPVGEAVLS